jgi:hypothetical protein
VAKNPQAVAQKWARNLGASTQDIVAGVDAVTTAPTQAAAARKTEMLAKLTNAVNSGKWERGLSRVSLQDWKNAMKDKGVQRVASGAQTAQPKMAAFMTEFLPVAESVSQQTKAMPKMTLEDSIARSAAAIRAFAEFGKSRK